jgi:Methionine biosynthesis protein MetW
MPKPELEKIADEKRLRQIVAERRSTGTAAAAPPLCSHLPPPSTKVALRRLLARMDDHRDILDFSLESPLPVVGPAISRGKGLLRRLMRTYLDRQSAFNAFLLEMGRLLALEQDRRLTLVESRLARMEELLGSPTSLADQTPAGDGRSTTQVLVARKAGAAILSWDSLPAPSLAEAREPTGSPCLRPTNALGSTGDPLTRCLCLFEDRKFVLAAGCGSDDFLALLQDKGVRSMGVDYCPACVDKTRDRGATVLPGGILDYLSKAGEGPLDGLVCANLIEHHAPADVVRLLTLANRAMPIGSPLVIASSRPAAVGPDDLLGQRYPLDILVPLAQVSGFEVQQLGSV